MKGPFCGFRRLARLWANFISSPKATDFIVSLQSGLLPLADVNTSFDALTITKLGEPIRLIEKFVNCAVMLKVG